MKVSLSWLKDYIPIRMDAADLAEALTMAGLEVEAVTDRYHYLESVRVGKILKITPHPNADKLKLCDVDIGDRTISVVCGAPNIGQHMLVPAALPGVVYPDGTVLKETVIRGVTSQGMLCSEAELALGADASGVMEIDSAAKKGARVAEALHLSDTLIEIDLTPNRPDCLSILGIAREIGAIQKNRPTYPDVKLPRSRGDISAITSITIEAPDHCPRYAARILEDITVAPSPVWLQDRLLSVGLRPINNIVDITNFVMMETGQPLHAFDFDLLAGHRIVVRTAEEGEVFITLDQKERRLSGDMLMICDGEKPVAIGGVMGGLNSEISENTRRVLIESAYFNPISIRKTAKRLGLGSDASHRFERGVDPGGTVKALNRAAQLMAEVGGGKLIKGVMDEYPGASQFKSKRIRLSVENTNRLLGTGLTAGEIKQFLESIEFDVKTAGKKNSGDHLVVVPPSFRVDVSRPEDLMEEVARLSGYNNIPATFPSLPAERRMPSKVLEIRDKIKQAMIGFGFTEAVNYSFADEQTCDRLGFSPKDTRRKVVHILNPLTEDQTVMRTSLLPGLLESGRRNIMQQMKDVKLFEIGKTFISSGEEALPEEKEMVAGLWTGRRIDASWHSPETISDFYDIKGVVQGLLDYLNIEGAVFTKVPETSPRYIRQGYSADIIIGNKVIGVVGEVNPDVLLNYGIKQPSYFFEIHLKLLIPLIPEGETLASIPRYPSIARDMTLIIDREIESGAILNRIKNLDEVILESADLFDVFEGGTLPPSKKSVSFRIIYRSPSETLDDERINILHQSVADRILREFDADLPKTTA